MRAVQQVRYTRGVHELFGKTVTFIRRIDGFTLRFNEDNGFVYLTSPDGLEAAIHGMHFESIILEPVIEKPAAAKDAPKVK